MKNRKQLIQMLSIAVLLFFVVAACDKTDDPGGNTLTGIVKDADGNKYNTIKIGNQVWMVENLKTTKYNDGTPIPNVTDNVEWSKLTIGAYCNYDNLESNGKIYGRLYNWYAVNTGKLAPKGWHVPTDADWTILENYLIDNGYNYDGSKEGNKIAKSLCAKTNWASSPTEGAPGFETENNNSTGFTALPGGDRFSAYGSFSLIGKYGYWWSSTEVEERYAYVSGMGFSSTDLAGINKGLKGNGWSVRLVRD